MKLRFKEEPGEWRKQALLSALGLAIISSLLCWRHVISRPVWLTLLGVLALIALVACLRPRWFRSYYRFSMRVGFVVSQFIGRAILLVVFLLIVTPMGCLLRMAGKDPLQLKRPGKGATCWQAAKEPGPLDRLF